MKNHPTLKIFLVYLGILIIILLIGACNPVKRVLKDKDKFEQVAREVVKAGYCVNDTVTIDTTKIVYKTKDSLIIDTVQTPCPDFDKTLSSGIRVISKDGKLEVKVPLKYNEKEITKTITNNIRDTKLENILRTERNEALDNYYKSEKQRDSLQKENKELQSIIKAKDRKYTFTLIGIGLVSLIFVFLKIKKILPF